MICGVAALLVTRSPRSLARATSLAAKYPRSLQRERGSHPSQYYRRNKDGRALATVTSTINVVCFRTSMRRLRYVLVVAAKHAD